MTTTKAGGEVVPFRERFGCTIREACAATGLKPTKLYEAMAAGAIESRKIGKRRIILVRSLGKLIEGDPYERPQTPASA